MLTTTSTSSNVNAAIKPRCKALGVGRQRPIIAISRLEVLDAANMTTGSADAGLCVRQVNAVDGRARGRTACPGVLAGASA
ncbi:MAG: hypothetical protein NTV94_18780 [Planctomycetota bacterium]|nr:hypothetical protein [Planctomycetota bacterium]